MILTYLFWSNQVWELSQYHYNRYGIIINDYNITDVYIGY